MFMFWLMQQLNVVKVEYLTMHMLVLFANTGVDMDLRQQGYIIDRMATIFPKSAYTPCIEEHNIHAIFRWECFLDIFREYEKQQGVGGVAVSMGGETGIASTSDKSSASPCVPLISLPVGLGEQKFLHNTGLTMSITTLGTCIYRVGTKRIKIDNVVGDTSVRGVRAGCRGVEALGISAATRNSSSHVHPSQQHLIDDTIPSEYSDVTEQFIFDICKYIQLVLVS